MADVDWKKLSKAQVEYDLILVKKKIVIKCFTVQ